MGPFIIGILVGWLAEFIFFTFFVKGRSTSDDSAKTNALRSELSQKNQEIVTLKAKLADAVSATKSSAVTAATSAPIKKSIASTPATSATVSKSPVAEAKTPSSQETAKTQTSSAVKADDSASNKTATNKTAPEKSSTASAKTAPKKAASKPAVDKVDTKKSASSKKKPVKKTATKTGDDLTLLSGIGPSMAATLNELGISSFKKLAGMDDNILRDMLEASGARLNNNKEAMDTWNEQAQLADKGDMEGLKKLQATLKKK